LRAAWLGVGLLVAWPRASRAELPSPADLDGWYITIGPVAAATRVAGSWWSAVGLEASVVRVAEASLPAAFGVATGGVSYAGRAGGRLWLEAELAVGPPVPAGLGVGVVAEVDPVAPPRPGAEATLWVYAGLVPYVRVGTVETTGAFLEAGVMVKLPIRFLY
jgi:hypothetical protein